MPLFGGLGGWYGAVVPIGYRLYYTADNRQGVVLVPVVAADFRLAVKCHYAAGGVDGKPFCVIRHGKHGAVVAELFVLHGYDGHLLGSSFIFIGT